MDGQDIIYSKWNPIVNGTKNWNIVLICHGFMGVEHAAVKVSIGKKKSEELQWDSTQKHLAQKDLII